MIRQFQDECAHKTMRCFSEVIDANRVVPFHNWGSYSTGELAIADCPDCGDPCLVEKGESRCETCKQYDADTAAAMLRAQKAAVLTMIIRHPGLSHGVPSYKGRGSMNDERQVFCSDCGDVAVTIPGDMLAEQAEGKQSLCESCRTAGAITLHDDDGGCWLTFDTHEVMP